MHQGAGGRVAGNTYGLLLVGGLGALGAGLLLALSLLEESLRDQDLVVGRDGSAHFKSVRSPAYRRRYGTERRLQELQLKRDILCLANSRLDLIGETGTAAAIACEVS